VSANPIGAVAVSHCPQRRRWRCPIDPAGRPFDVFNGEVERTVDLNADLGERESVTEVERGVIDAVTSVSIACGFHAGSPAVMRDVARICRDQGVAIGAHVSYRDRAGFGRRAMHVEADQLLADILEQCDALAMAASGVGADVAYVKPHGALYNAMATDDDAAAAVVEAVAAQSHTVLVAQAHTTVVRLADAAGVRTIYEGFPDRGYLSDGRLAPRDAPEAIVHDPEAAGARACSLVLDGGIVAVDGNWTPVIVDSLCVHGDTPDADRVARSVRAALESARVVLRSFTTDVPDPTDGGP
jgi:5-oxoprolinase (ATP-hydrolysing) subunit A